MWLWEDSCTSALKQGSVSGQQVQQLLQPGVSAWTAGYKLCVTGGLYKGREEWCSTVHQWSNTGGSTLVSCCMEPMENKAVP